MARAEMWLKYAKIASTGWYTYPSEKYESMGRIASHILWKIKDV
jgi:hypothetical protein